MKFDSHNNVFGQVAVNNGAISSSTTTAGNIIDTQGFNSLEFFLQVGARTDGTYTLSMEHGDAANLSDTATPAADDIVGTLAATAASAANAVKRVGYVGNKRYVRVNIVSTSVTSGATAGVLAVLGRASVAPTAAN